MTFENHLNLSYWYSLDSSMYQGFNFFTVFLHNFVLAKLATSSIRIIIDFFPFSFSPLMSDPSPTPPPYSGRPSPANRNQRRTHRENDNGYHSNSDGSRDEMPGRGKSAAARFCHECGTKYPVMSAKFCCECGMKRVFIT